MTTSRATGRSARAQEFITAVSSEHVPIIEGKLDASNVKIMVDSGSSISLVDKAYLPSACLS